MSDDKNLDFKLFDTFLDGVLVIDGEEKLCYCNSAFSNLLNTSLPRLKRHSALSSYVKFTPALFEAGSLSDIREPVPYREIEFESKGGRRGQVQVSIQPMGQTMGQQAEHSGHVPGISDSLWVIYFRDVTLEATLHGKYRDELDKKEQAIQKLQDAQKKLKEYSQTLEKKVEERTADLGYKNQMLTAMVNSVGQAFVLVDKEGICSKTFSRVTLNLLEMDPSLKPISKVLKISPQQMEPFQNWLKLLLEERIPFDRLVHLGPKTFPHSRGLHIALEFHPIREEENKLSGLVVVATDKTNEIQALMQAEQEQAMAKRVIKLAKFKDLFWHFVAGAEKALEDLQKLLGEAKPPTAKMEEILRAAHTLKGEANLFWMVAVAQDMHDFETVMKETVKQPLGAGWPVCAQKARGLIDRARKNMAEFMKENAHIIGEHRGAPQKQVEVSYEKLQAFFNRLGPQETLAREFEREFLKEPIGKFFEQYNDLISSLAEGVGKLVNPVTIRGQDVRIIVEDYQSVLDNLVHLVNNAVHHGIEIPEIRQKRGKVPFGTISVDIAENSSGYRVVVEDDGEGIDPKMIREKIADAGLSGSEKPDDEVIQHIFDPGFSTSRTVSKASGRGFGLNALFEAVKESGGEIKVSSEPEKWTRFEMTLPLKKQSRAA